MATQKFTAKPVPLPSKPAEKSDQTRKITPQATPATTATQTQSPTEREIGDDEPLNIPVTRKELETVSNAVRALHLIHDIAKGGGGVEPIDMVSVLLDSFSGPAFEVAHELEMRYQEAEIRAASGGETLDRLHTDIAKGK